MDEKSGAGQDVFPPVPLQTLHHFLPAPKRMLVYSPIATTHTREQTTTFSTASQQQKAPDGATALFSVE